MSLLTYSPSEVNVLIAGLLAVSGYADGQFVNISKDETPFQYAKSMDGGLARLCKKDDTYTIQLTLAQTSPTNNVLSLLHKIDRLRGVGKFPLFIKDGSGTFLLYASNCWVESLPSVSFSNGMETRVWSIKASFADMTVGGNDTGLLSDILGGASILLSGLDVLGV
jgi:hypothetical protein